MNNEKIVRDFISAWSRLDAAELSSYFTEDGVYHNIPTGPVRGRATIKGFIAGFIRPWTETHWEIHNLSAQGDLVMVERTDKIQMGSKSVELPCVGIFEMNDGKIRVWRDYFDLGTYMKAMQ